MSLSPDFQNIPKFQHIWEYIKEQKLVKTFIIKMMNVNYALVV